MKNCRKCSEEILDGAKMCKHCGTDQRNWFVRHWIVSGIIGLILLGVIFGSTGTEIQENDENQQEIQENIKIDSETLYNEYMENEISADEIYKSRTLDVSGSVESIGKDILDNMYVLLKGDGFVFGVQCMLESSEKEAAAKLSKGNIITVTGKNSGKLGNIVLKNCSIN